MLQLGETMDMGGLQDAVKAASDRAVLERQKMIRERRIQYAGDVYGYAAAYDNAIVLAGYAAFFGLWAGVSQDVSPFCRVVTASLMGISLISYIVWHLVQMLTRQKFEFEKADTFNFENDPVRFNDAWEQIERRHNVAQIRVLRFWPYTFVPSVALGILGGLTLIWNTAMIALDLPLQLIG